MADTGAPHFIPYIEPTDLVRDYPAADEAQAEAVADALDAAGGLVAVKNVYYVDSTTAEVFSSTPSATYKDVTGLSITLTPESADSEFFCYSQVGASTNVSARFFIGTKILRDATDIVGLNHLGGTEDNGFALHEFSVRASDSPGTTSPITYKVQVAPEGGSTVNLFVNRNENQTASKYRSFLLVVEYQ